MCVGVFFFVGAFFRQRTSGLHNVRSFRRFVANQIGYSLCGSHMYYVTRPNCAEKRALWCTGVYFVDICVELTWPISPCRWTRVGACLFGSLHMFPTVKSVPRGRKLRHIFIDLLRTHSRNLTWYHPSKFQHVRHLLYELMTAALTRERARGYRFWIVCWFSAIKQVAGIMDVYEMTHMFSPYNKVCTSIDFLKSCIHIQHILHVQYVARKLRFFFTKCQCVLWNRSFIQGWKVGISWHLVLLSTLWLKQPVRAICCSPKGSYRFLLDTSFRS